MENNELEFGSGRLLASDEEAAPKELIKPFASVMPNGRFLCRFPFVRFPLRAGREGAKNFPFAARD